MLTKQERQGIKDMFLSLKGKGFRVGDFVEVIPKGMFETDYELGTILEIKEITSDNNIVTEIAFSDYDQDSLRRTISPEWVYKKTISYTDIMKRDIVVGDAVVVTTNSNLHFISKGSVCLVEEVSSHGENGDNNQKYKVVYQDTGASQWMDYPQEFVLYEPIKHLKKGDAVQVISSKHLSCNEILSDYHSFREESIVKYISKGKFIAPETELVQNLLENHVKLIKHT